MTTYKGVDVSQHNGNVDTKKLKATYVDGLLTVFIPVKEKEESNDLEIEIL